MSSEEIFYDEDITGEKFISIQNPDLNVFESSELASMAEVKTFFKGWSARKISDFSHNEKGYQETPNGHLISYSYAENLQI